MTLWGLPVVRACLNGASPCTACAGVDCEVGPWGAWDPCSTTCGTSVQSRSRSIIVGAENGGAACPALEETRNCNTDACGMSVCWMDGTLHQLPSTPFHTPALYKREREPATYAASFHGYAMYCTIPPCLLMISVCDPPCRYTWCAAWGCHADLSRHAGHVTIQFVDIPL